MAPDLSKSAIPLSVVITTVDEPGMVIRKFSCLLEQVRHIKGELLIVSNLAAAQLMPPGIRVHQVPGGSIFDCRAAAISLARGEIIAFTEDHCVLPPDWCKRIMDNFSSRPALKLLGGTVDNGSTQCIADLINYWTTFALYAPGQLVARHPCIAQLIVKSSVINRPPVPGTLEFQCVSKFLNLPGAIYMDKELVVLHVQSHGFWKTFAVHFHNGRASSGLSTLSTTHNEHNPKIMQSFWRAFMNMAIHLRQSHVAFKAGGKPLAIRAMYLSMIFPLTISHCLGAMVGYYQGPGTSPHRLV